tara:strand:+ start:1092 stop:1553 length:462 start_codon:yes stop_codon:yes gene_type:complete
MLGGKTYKIEQKQTILTNRSEVFEFFSDAFNLELLTPKFLNFRILTPPPINIKEGTIIQYKISLFGVPMKWKTEIEKFEPENLFVDNQVKGPYSLWHHTHIFEETENGTLMTDIVNYRLPFGILGRIAHTIFVRRTLKKIFAHRKQEISQLFG